MPRGSRSRRQGRSSFLRDLMEEDIEVKRSRSPEPASTSAPSNEDEIWDPTRGNISRLNRGDNDYEFLSGTKRKYLGQYSKYQSADTNISNKASTKSRDDPQISTNMDIPSDNGIHHDIPKDANNNKVVEPYQRDNPTIHCDSSSNHDSDDENDDDGEDESLDGGGSYLADYAWTTQDGPWIFQPTTSENGIENTIDYNNPNDLGVSDLASWLQYNSKAYGKKVPREDDWARILKTGLPEKKNWNLNMSIEAAFRQFELAGAPIDVLGRRILHDTPLTRLLREVIAHMKEHFKKEDLRKKKDKKRGNKSNAESSLVRSTRSAASRARIASMEGRQSEVATLLPSHSKILACWFTSPDGSIDESLAGGLMGCGHGHLLGLKRKSAEHMSFSNSIDSNLVSPMPTTNPIRELEKRINNIKEELEAEIQDIDATFDQVFEILDELTQDPADEINEPKQDPSVKIDKMKQDLSAKIDKVNQDLSDKIKEAQQDLSAKIEKMKQDLSAEIEKGGTNPSGGVTQHTQPQFPAGSRSGDRPSLTATVPISPQLTSNANRRKPTATLPSRAPKKAKTIDDDETERLLK
ncbi:hypothetical protein FLONG3_11429 [Fusarium longipes]|uniref:Uncharacterized protein n=1 Tax=Fusarium longipes TaxID=694270 RepID=A0A395REG5_9HYPO|nr:hypothetical protein FLONG3_11429 [Fusarium longipes]